MTTYWKDGGIYTGRILESHLGKSKVKGTAFVQFIVEITGEKIGETVREIDDQSTVEVVRYITENTVESLIDGLRTLGYTHNSFDPLDGDYPWNQQEVEVRCKHEVYTNSSGKTFNQEKFDFIFGGSYTSPISKAEVAKLNSFFSNAFKVKNAQKEKKEISRPTSRTPRSASTPPDTEII